MPYDTRFIDEFGLFKLNLIYALILSFDHVTIFNEINCISKRHGNILEITAYDEMQLAWLIRNRIAHCFDRSPSEYADLG